VTDDERLVTRRSEEVGFRAENIAMNLPRLPLASDNQVVIFTRVSKPNRVNLLDSVMDKQETLTPPCIVDSSLHYDSKSLATYWARSTTFVAKMDGKKGEIEKVPRFDKRRTKVEFHRTKTKGEKQ